MRRRYDFSNFYLNTVADWARCEIPDRPPDFTSYAGSAYWDCGRSVKRLSDHWGKVATCRWLIEGLHLKAFVCGKCYYDEFRSTRALEEPMDELGTTVVVTRMTRPCLTIEEIKQDDGTYLPGKQSWSAVDFDCSVAPEHITGKHGRLTLVFSENGKLAESWSYFDCHVMLYPGNTRQKRYVLTYGKVCKV